MTEIGYYVVISLLILFAVIFILFIIEGIGLYRMAKKLDIEFPYLAFIPWAKYYLVGFMAKDEVKIPSIGVILILGPIFLWIADLFLTIINITASDVIFAIIVFLYLLLLIYVFIMLAKKFTRDYFLFVATLLVILFPLRSIIIFVLSFKNPVDKNDEYFEVDLY